MDFTSFNNYLWQQDATGERGFEGLIRKVLEELTGLSFYLAAPGRQEGRDVASSCGCKTYIVAECKRYDEQTALGSDELMVKMQRASRSMPQPDIFIVVTTKRLSDQHQRDLFNFASDIGISCLIIDAAGGDASMIASLCSISPQTVIEHFRTSRVDIAPGEEARIEEYLKNVRSSPAANKNISKLKNNIFNDASGYDLWKQKQNTWLVDVLKSEEESMASFSQDVAVLKDSRQVVKRGCVTHELNLWWESWPKQAMHFALLGEEGDGKSWAVCDWISTKIGEIDFPPVVLIPSARISGTDFLKLISDTVQGQLNSSRGASWYKKISRWLSVNCVNKPLCIIVIDGLNERFSYPFDRLFNELKRDIFYGIIAVIVTCRTNYWNERVVDKNSIFYCHAIQPYNDSELAEALKIYDISPDNFHGKLINLLRKPRYFDLAMRLREKLDEFGEITPDRLIYEDWKDKLSRKISASNLLSNDEFSEFIATISNKWRDNKNSFAREDLSDELECFGDKKELFSELVSSGIVIKRSVRKWSIDQKYLTLGLGLLLADEIFEARNISVENYDEIIATWLEPHADMDVKVSICGKALIYAIYRHDFPASGRISLFKSWIGARNIREDDSRDIIAYIPRCPDLYINIAEIIWTAKNNNAEAQDILIKGFYDYRDNPNFKRVLSSAFERWMGFVHIDGHSGRHAQFSDQELRIKSRKKVQELLGIDATEGTFDRYGYSLEILTDDGLLRLSGVALAIISHVDRLPFIRTIVAGAISGAAMGHPTYHEEYYWVLRTAPDNLEDKIIEIADDLVKRSEPLAQKSAWWLLRSLGTELTIEKSNLIPEEFHFVNPMFQFEMEHPCDGFSSWSKEKIPECIKVEGMSLDALAQKLKGVSLDPEFKDVFTIRDKIKHAQSNINVENIFSSGSTSIDKFNLKEIEPALCAYNPQKYAIIWHLIIGLVPRYRGRSLYFLSMSLCENVFILTTEEVRTIDAAWLRALSSDEEYDDLAEMLLFSISLWGKTTKEQFELISKRGGKTTYLSDNPYYINFITTEDGEMVVSYLSTFFKKDRKVFVHALWCISRQIITILPKLHEYFVSHFDEFENYERALCFEIFTVTGDVEGCQFVISSGWKASSAVGEEAYWGSRLIAEFGTELNFIVLAETISLPLLGLAVFHRGLKEDEVSAFADLLNSALSHHSEDCDEIPPQLNNIELITADDPNDFIKYWVFNEWDSDNADSLTFRSWDSVWGGAAGQGNIMNFKRRLNQKDREKSLKDRWKICKDFVDGQAKINNYFFSEWFSVKTLEAIVMSSPEMVDFWIKELEEDSSLIALRLFYKKSFYENLCEACLCVSPANGLKLLDIILKYPSFKVVDPMTGMQNIVFYLFKPTESQDILIRKERFVKDANTNMMLFDIAFAALIGEDIAFLEQLIDKYNLSESRIERAVSIVFLGFLDSEFAKDRLEQLTRYSSSSWEKDIAVSALKIFNTNQWAKQWFAKFVTSDDSTEAWAFFKLFLHTVDRRYFVWKDILCKELAITKDKMLILKTYSRLISSTIKENEKDNMKLKDKFLGFNILKNQVNPWMHKS